MKRCVAMGRSLSRKREASRHGQRQRQLSSLTPQDSASVAGLRYVAATRVGYRRVRNGQGFRYMDGAGKPLPPGDIIARIKALAIPPAWTEVWISPYANGHLQATGRDARGRKQYRYHPDWCSLRDETKYGRMMEFARCLPRIWRRVRRDLAEPGLPRRKVLAAVVQLLQTTLIRVGNDEYARDNNSVGLTTMQDHHAEVNGSAARFEFRGKGGRWHSITCDDQRLAKIVKQCQELPGEELFQYLDEAGEPTDVGSADVNEYLREISGGDFTAKDFRTWAGTVLAAATLAKCTPCSSQTRGKRKVARVIAEVADRLGNTPAICRKCYVHPAVIEAYLDGSLPKTCAAPASGSSRLRGLNAPERATLGFLERHGKQTRKSLMRRSAAS